jgi:hypothetical protein
MPTFYKVHYDADTGTKSASGQCKPSQTPGAYYTLKGEKDDDGKSDRSWSCWNTNMDKSLWTNEEARKQNFAGACMFKDFSSTTQPQDVEDCSEHLSHHPAICQPGPSVYWGACWSSRSENWHCIPQGDQAIQGLAKGDCSADVLLQDKSSDPTDFFFDGVCRFPEEHPTMYKCESVTSYSKGDAGTCGQKVDQQGTDKACFSLTHGMQWTCFDKKTDFPTPCDWTLQPSGPQAFYRGSCVFEGNKFWKHAVDARNLTVSVPESMVV